MNRFTALIRRYPIASVGLLVAVVAGVIWLRPKTPTAVVQPPPPAGGGAGLSLCPSRDGAGGSRARSAAGEPAAAGAAPAAALSRAGRTGPGGHAAAAPDAAVRGGPTDRRSRRHGPCGDTQDRRPGIHRCPGRDNPEQDPRRTGGRERRPRHPD